MKWFLTGDCHGNFSHFIDNPALRNLQPYEVAIIILGDAGINIYGDERDEGKRKYLNNLGYRFYCVRGNHELRPTQVLNIVSWRFDTYVENYVWQDKNYPNINYLEDGQIYKIWGKRVLVIGGAYSVDKPYRLMNNYFWNPQEQLEEKEREVIYNTFKDNIIDVVLSHTCPYDWQPTDLFLSQVDQSTVDNTMEKFLQKCANYCYWSEWYWGHFHRTREYYPLDEDNQKRMMIYHDFIPFGG